MSFSFAVDAVTPVFDRLPTVTLSRAAARLVGTNLEVLSHDVDVVDDTMASLFGERVHPLIACVHRAFAEHRPLTLSPDHIWLTIARGFADHVDEHAEALRGRFVRHEGQTPLVVEVMARPQTDAEWRVVVDGFAADIAEYTGPGVVRLLGCDFSTTTTVERVASRVVTMAAFKKYFDYRVYCVCGIPRVTLEGSVDDWREIRRRIDVLAEYDLQWWAAALRPVCDALVETAAGRPDPDFWRSIYKPEEAYGGDVATGWLMRLFPYHQDRDGGRSRSHIFANDHLHQPSATNPWLCAGVAPSAPPAGLSVAPVVLHHAAGPIVEETVRLYAGFCGFRQQPDGALRPEVAWAVGPPPASTGLIDRLLARPGAHVVKRAASHDGKRDELPAVLCEFYDRYDGLKLDDIELWPRARFQYTGYETTDATVFGTSTDQQIAFSFGEGGSALVFTTTEGGHPEDAVVVAETCDALLTLLAAGAPLAPLGPLYPRLPRHVLALRRVLESCEGPPRDDLDQREQEVLAKNLLLTTRGTPEQRAFWRASLIATFNVTTPQAHTFRPMAWAALEKLGLR